MNDRQKNTPEPSGSRVRTSIANKLSSRMFFRLLGVFISLDILICMIASASLLVYGEQKAASAVELLQEIGPLSDGLLSDEQLSEQPESDGLESSGISADEASRWLELSGIRIVTGVSGTEGIQIPEPFSQLLPKETDTARRAFTLAEGDTGSFYSMMRRLEYTIYVNQDAVIYAISVGLGGPAALFSTAFTVFLVLQLLTLLGRIPRDARMVRATLEPITRLSEAARSLNEVGSRFDPDKMAALAGKLEGIDAAKLDTRIQVDDTQAELQNLARAINAMLDRINESYRAQVRFVSDASHELRTPISVIQGYANLLDRWGKNDPKTLQESITAIKDETANMKDLVEQLLFLARGDNNTLTLQMESIRLAELADETVREMQMIDSAHQFHARLKEVTVVADRGLLKQALRILLDNAVKYTDAGGNITVTTGEQDGFAKLSVSDEGIGISPEIIPRIFDRFYRADESRARATGGAGLGLSIAKWITARHGGHMEVLSRVGIGTRITVDLPSAPAEEIPPAAEPIESPVNDI